MRRAALIGLGVLAALCAGYAAGRYAIPPRVVEKRVTDTQAIEVAIAAAKAEWAKDVRTTTTKVVRLRDGKPIEITIARDSETHAIGSTSSTGSTASAIATHVETAKTVEGARPSWAIQARGPVDLSRYGVDVQRRIVGPFWLGAGVERSDRWVFLVGVRVEFQP